MSTAWRGSSTNDVVWRARRFLALPRAEQRLLLRAYMGLGLAEVGLRTVGFRRLMACVPEVDQEYHRPIEAATMQCARAHARWLEVASRHHILRAQCLHRAIVLHYWLRRAHLPSTLRIGVRKDGSALAAHAWVELAGEPLGDHPSSIDSFTRLPALDARRINATYPQ